MGPTVAGVAYFVGVKFAGYSAAGALLNRAAGVHRPNPLGFGLARTGIGVAAGVSYAFALSWLLVTSGEIWFYPGLLPVRILEWLLVLWLFYQTAPAIWQKRMRYVTLGTVWSYALDLVALIAAFAIPGGFWIC